MIAAGALVFAAVGFAPGLGGASASGELTFASAGLAQGHGLGVGVGAAILPIPHSQARTLKITAENRLVGVRLEFRRASVDFETRVLAFPPGQEEA
jgi:hypothetical protein